MVRTASAAAATSAAAAAEAAAAAAEAAAGAEAVHTSHPGLITRCSYQPEFIEAKSHNIIEVKERLFITRGHHSSLYYMSLVPLIISNLAYGEKVSTVSEEIVSNLGF